MRFSLASIAVALAACSQPGNGTLAIRILDAAGGAPMAARVELLDASGEAQVPPEALTLRFECAAAPLPDWAARWASLSDRIWNPPTGTYQFYLDGGGAIELPPGRYRLRVFRGIEYRVARREIEIAAGEQKRVDVALERWADMEAAGWWSADDHIHVTRRTPADDRNIAAWMAAEDLNVANLLQMGTVDQIDVTPQPGFGDAGAFRSGGTLVLAGQEHPRTHFLGHTITLGADALVDRRDSYIAYETTFREALERGGLPGFAHWGLGPARRGLTLDAPRGLVFFVEVLQFDFPWYREWYDLLDLGIRMAPTAGTDFPCGDYFGVPGRERFYVPLDAEPTRASFVAAVRDGRTFVTNGPLLDLRAGEAGIGDEISLDGPSRIPIRARVRFDPERDDVKRVELVVNGEPWPAPTTRAGPGELRVETEVEFAASGWLALRAEGDKVGEMPIAPARGGIFKWVFEHGWDFREVGERSEDYYAGRSRVRPSAAHTAAIFVNVRGSGPGPQRISRAREALARLDDLEARLGDDRLPDQTLWDWFPYADAVSEEHLRRNRPALLRAVAEARERYTAILGDG